MSRPSLPAMLDHKYIKLYDRLDTRTFNWFFWNFKQKCTEHNRIHPPLKNKRSHPIRRSSSSHLSANCCFNGQNPTVYSASREAFIYILIRWEAFIYTGIGNRRGTASTDSSHLDSKQYTLLSSLQAINSSCISSEPNLLLAPVDRDQWTFHITLSGRKEHKQQKI